MHRITELADLGRLPTMTDDMAAVAARWRKALEVADAFLAARNKEDDR